MHVTLIHSVFLHPCPEEYNVMLEGNDVMD